MDFAASGIFLVVVAWIEVRGLRLAYSSIGLSGAVMPGHLLARPVPGVGIALAVFVPPLSAVAIALLISRWQSAALAYAGGSVGRLIGGDLLTSNKVQGPRAPVASIGGAGTFDGIFLTGILGVLIASVFSGTPALPDSYASVAVVGSIIRRTSVTLFAGKPLRRACS
jgi:uncharacterized membrane protein